MNAIYLRSNLRLYKTLSRDKSTSKKHYVKSVYFIVLLNKTVF